MAGGKETPRQKMIGMMYMVLTALLALQVASAILLKFKFIDDSLMTVNIKTVGDNTNAVKSISDAVSKAGNSPDDKRVMNAAAAVRSQTGELVTYIHSLRQDLITKTGGTLPDGSYKDVSAESIVANFMIGAAQKRDGRAYDLEKKLNGYANSMREVLKPHQIDNIIPAKLALGGSEDPMARKDEAQRSKDFAELNFEATPLVAALAVLAQKETEILKYESDALAKLSEKVGATKITFDKVMATATAESNTVAAGTKYKANMFLSAFSSAIAPRMASTAGPVRVQNGVGTIEFTASAAGGSRNKDGLLEKQWSGTITMKKKNGQDTTYKVQQKYFVVEPSIRIISAAVQALYYKCGNRLKVIAPELGAMYNPVFSGAGASFVKGSSKEEVMIIPNSTNKVTLNVSSGGNQIGKQDFDVRRVPKPRVEILINGKATNDPRGMRATDPKLVTIRIIPDEDFAKAFPEDARYMVSNYEVGLVSGGNIQRPAKYSTSQANISSLTANARPGDKLFVRMNEVVRINYKNDIEEIPGVNDTKVIPLY